MTKEEALARLRDYAHGFYQGSTDRIPPHSFDLNRETTDILEKALLNDMQGWIPCSSRLPDDEEKEYLVTILDRDDDVCEVYKGFYQDGKWWTQWCHGCLELEKEPCGDNIVTAWMPLPEPWRGEQE